MRRKFIFIISLFVFILMITGCNNNTTPTKEVTTTDKNLIDDTKFDQIWNEEYQDINFNFNNDTVQSSKLFYEGEYVSLDTKVSKRKDSKKEFYTDNSLRFVNTPNKYAITLPSKDVKIDYSIANYHIQFEFNDSILTISHETSSPYGSNINGWNTYLNEWLNRYVNNQKYLLDNNLSYLEDPVTTTKIIDGYEVITYSIYINDSSMIERPYYNISIIRKENEYVEFYLLVMKSKTNTTAEHRQILRSFKQVKQYGYPESRNFKLF